MSAMEALDFSKLQPLGTIGEFLSSTPARLQNSLRRVLSGNGGSMQRDNDGNSDDVQGSANNDMYGSLLDNPVTPAIVNPATVAGLSRPPTQYPSHPQLPQYSPQQLTSAPHPFSSTPSPGALFSSMVDASPAGRPYTAAQPLPPGNVISAIPPVDQPQQHFPNFDVQYNDQKSAGRPPQFPQTHQYPDPSQNQCFNEPPQRRQTHAQERPRGTPQTLNHAPYLQSRPLDNSHLFPGSGAYRQPDHLGFDDTKEARNDQRRPPEFQPGHPLPGPSMSIQKKPRARHQLQPAGEARFVPEKHESVVPNNAQTRVQPRPPLAPGIAPSVQRTGQPTGSHEHVASARDVSGTATAVVQLTPSSFCHVCGRPNSRCVQVVCANIAQGVCQKAVCNLCFDRLGWPNFYEATLPGSGWTCCHCRDLCPETARCFVYKKANKRRCIRRRAQRLARDQSRAAAAAAAAADTQPNRSADVPQNDNLDGMAPPEH